MPLLPVPPFIRLLEAALASLVLVEDWVETTGVDVNTVRHARDRQPTRSEGKTVSLDWVGNEDTDIDEIQKNAQEKQKRCMIDITIDLKRRTESSAEDPTGWLDHGRVAARVLMALRDEDGPLMQLCDWVIDGEEDPDEDSKPDEGRLVKRISVVYRVRADDPNHLLAMGENG